MVAPLAVVGLMRARRALPSTMGTAQNTTTARSANGTSILQSQRCSNMEAKHWYCETHNRVRIDDDNPVAFKSGGGADLRFKALPRITL
ncbi:hypothetical protein BJY52DRAFT_1274713 [Lactarius psammicola]|nr:hypothetical protein BJY52DRAFT_1274713 [Lactarius psammicola]